MSGIPPKWVLKLLRVACKEHLLEEIEGDLQEYYSDWIDTFGRQKANRLFVLHALKFIRPYSIKIFSVKTNNLSMFKSHLKLAWRGLGRQPVFSLIKIGGFALGIAVCSLIALYVQYQLNFDSHYKKEGRIYRMVNQWSDSDGTGFWANVHGPLKAVMEENIPEIQKAARVVLWSWGDGGDNHIKIAGETQQYYEEGFIYADPELLAILEVPMKYGSQEMALSTPNSIVISHRKAQKYFPDRNPVGEQIILNDNPESTYTIGGVMETFRSNTHLDYDFIMTLEGRQYGPGTSGWCCTNYNMYVQLTENSQKEAVEEKTKVVRNSLVLDALRENGTSGLEEMEKYQSYYLQPVTDIYLNPEEVGDHFSHGSAELVRIFSVSAFIVLVLACINFINLSTAKATARAKEVGIRKAIGSFRSSLIQQYLVESWMHTFFAFIIGLSIASALLPVFNRFLGISLFLPWNDAWFLLLLICSFLLVGFLSGIYPAYYLSSFSPIKVLKGRASDSAASTVVRNGTIVFQFGTTFLLVISAMVLYHQFDYLINKALGYEKDQVINVVGLETLNDNKKEVFHAELRKIGAVENASSSDYIPVSGGSIQNRSFWQDGRKGLDNGHEAAYWRVDEHYIPTLQIELLRGRNFAKEGDGQSIIINERMAEALRLSEPLGKRLVDMFDEEYHVIGVVKDFHFESLLQETRPLALVKGTGRSTLSVKIRGSQMENTIAAIERLWTQIQPNQPLRYQFMSLKFESMYEDLNRAKVLFIAFSILSVSIACSGLFAMSVYMAERRRKEVGIRKVLGASMARIISLLSVDFVKLILLATIIATPLAWYFLDELMADFPYRIDLGWDFFILTTLLVSFIGLGTVSYETIKATRVNPAEILKDE